MNKCNICGKFRKWQELIEIDTAPPSSCYTWIHYECIYCNEKNNNKDNNNGQ